jgi:hypothetical protein
LLVFVVLAASLSAFSLSLAFADDGFVVDEDDSPGPLDIERFGFFRDADGGHLVLDLYEEFDASFLNESLNWVGFILEDDIADGEYERAVFVRNTGEGLVARLYSHGRTGSDPGTFIDNVVFHVTDPDLIEVVIPPRQYAPFHHWYAQTAFETTGQDDRGYPDCNWPTPPPRPFPPMAKCIDESMGITPTFDGSPFPTDTGGPPTPPPCDGQSQCKKAYITIHRGDHFFRGVVRHPRNICEDERRVVLKRTDGERIGSDVTDFQGRWRVWMEEADGDFYAFAREVSIARSHAEDVFCRRVRSITAHV